MSTNEQYNKYTVKQIEAELTKKNIRFYKSWCKEQKIKRLLSSQPELTNQPEAPKQSVEKPKEEKKIKIIKRIEPQVKEESTPESTITDFKELLQVKPNIKTLLQIKDKISYVDLRKLLLEYFNKNNLFDKGLINVESLQFSKKQIKFSDIDIIVNDCFLLIG